MRIFRKNIQQNTAVNEHAWYYLPLVSANISFVLILTLPLLRKCLMMLSPLRAFPIVLCIRTVEPLTSNSTSQFGNRPAAFRTSMGIVTCPLLEIRTFTFCVFLLLLVKV
jgi:hypothetical protein